LESCLRPNVTGNDSLKRLVRRHRAVAQNHPNPPAILADLGDIREKLQYFKNRNHFLLYDSVKENVDRFLIFGSAGTIEWLNTCTAIFRDGTFKVALPIFTQLYVIIGLKVRTALHSLYVLLNGKSKQLYENVFKEVKQLCNDTLNPHYILTDFEKASISAFQSVFKKSKQKGCYFHFKQAVIRKFKEHSLVWQNYLKDPTFANHLKMLITLACVPCENVINYFDLLMATPVFKQAYQYEDKDEGEDLDALVKGLKEFLTYFEATWIRRFGRHSVIKHRMFKIEIWNVYKSVINEWAKTNNYCEGFNNSFNSITIPNPNIYKFLADLMLKHELTMKELGDFNTGFARPPNKKKSTTIITQGYNISFRILRSMLLSSILMQ